MGFKDILHKAWMTHIEGTQLFQVVMKLKVLKLALKNWRKTSFDTPEARIQLLRQNLEKVLNQLSEDPTNIQN